MAKKIWVSDLDHYSTIDRLLIEIFVTIKPLYYIEPINQREEKEKFLRGKIRNPKFLYRELEYDPKEIEKKLALVEIPDDDLGRIFSRKKMEALRMNKILINRGNKRLVREIASTAFGVPSEELVDYANELIKKMPNIEDKKVAPSYKVKKALEGALKEAGLEEWRVEFSEKWLTTVYAGERRITVCKNRKFSKNDPEGAVVHEVGVHVVRAANGFEQPLQVFGIGLPGYISTEEGLALYFGKLTATSSSEMIRNYAGRVIAADSVCNNLSFKQTFEKLKASEFTDDQAWGLAVRVHRGGGFIKDHVYLQGCLEVEDFAKKDGDFKALYVGKIGIKDLPLVRRLLKEGFLKKAKYLPPFLK